MNERDPYLALLTQSGKRKFKATMRLPYRDAESRFEAAVLFHEAADLEDQALSLISEPSAEVRLGAAIERCACLILGLDVFGSISAIHEVERLSANLPMSTANLLQERLEPMVKVLRRDFHELLSKSPILVGAAFRWERIAHKDKLKAREELAHWLERFPGDPIFYLIHSRAAVDARQLDEARRAAMRAYRLQPSNPYCRWVQLLFVADAMGNPDALMSQADALEHLTRTHDDLLREPADALVYLGFMIASFAAFLVAQVNGDATTTYRNWVRWAAEVGCERPGIDPNAPKNVRAVGHLLAILLDRPETLTTIIESLMNVIGSAVDVRQTPSMPNVGRSRTPGNVIRDMTHLFASAAYLNPSLDLAA